MTEKKNEKKGTLLSKQPPHKRTQNATGASSGEERSVVRQWEEE